MTVALFVCLLTFHRGHAASSGTSPGVPHCAQGDPVLHQCVSRKGEREGEREGGRRGREEEERGQKRRRGGIRGEKGRRKKKEEEEE